MVAVDRESWARTRMMDRFALRVPAAVAQGITASFTAADRYIEGYNIRMDRLLAEDGSRPFPEGLRLITHWGLRDELKARYADADGPPRQRMIQKVMERIIRQEIPAAVIDNPLLDWNPYTNAVTVESGLNPGDVVVTAGVQALRPGQKVRPIETKS